MRTTLTFVRTAAISRYFDTPPQTFGSSAANLTNNPSSSNIAPLRGDAGVPANASKSGCVSIGSCEGDRLSVHIGAGSGGVPDVAALDPVQSNDIAACPPSSKVMDLDSSPRKVYFGWAVDRRTRELKSVSMSAVFPRRVSWNENAPESAASERTAPGSTITLERPWMVTAILLQGERPASFHVLDEILHSQNSLFNCFQN